MLRTLAGFIAQAVITCGLITANQRFIPLTGIDWINAIVDQDPGLELTVIHIREQLSAQERDLFGLRPLSIKTRQGLKLVFPKPTAFADMTCVGTDTYITLMSSQLPEAGS